MDKAQLQRERDRLQVVLDGHNAREAMPDRHVGLIARIANLDYRLTLAAGV